MSKDLKRSIVLFVISLIMVVVMMVFNIDNKLMWLLAYAIGAYEKAMEGIRLTLRDKSLNVEFLMILDGDWMCLDWLLLRGCYPDSYFLIQWHT